MSSLKNIYIPHYTHADYKQWEGRWELIYGIPYAMSPLPSIRHQLISGHIFTQLQTQLSSCSDCTVLMPVDWKIAEDIVVQPDLSVICYPADGNYLTKAPVMIFEIFSPSTKEKDQQVKYELYKNAAVKYYVMVDPDWENVSIYQLIAGDYRLLKGDFNGEIIFEFDACNVPFDFSVIWRNKI